MRIKNVGLLITFTALGVSAQCGSACRTADIVFVVDQSGSMAPGSGPLPPGSSGFAYRATPTSTPIFYQALTGCTNPWNAGPINPSAGVAPGTPGAFGAITIQPAVGAAINLFLLYSEAGCTDLVGDPYSIRESAVEKAIDYIVAASPTSTVGYLPFAAGVQTPLNSQRPLALTATNVTSLKTKIIIANGGTTNYDVGLDSAKLWLTTPSITPSTANKKVIIFISDGAPNPIAQNGLGKNANGSYIHIDTTHVVLSREILPRLPIYSIFLGAKATADTANLKTLSDLTHGKFYRVPPQNQDSLAMVVRGILSCLLGGPTSLRSQHPMPNLLEGPSGIFRWFDLRGRTMKAGSEGQAPVLPVEIRREAKPN